MSKQLKLGQKVDWAAITGTYGKPMDIKVKELHVDARYQRPKQFALIARIANNFNKTTLTRLTVMRRSGVYYVVDGQQRLNAALLRGDVTELPCDVYDSSGMSNEAFHFAMINGNRRAVKAIDSFRAAVIARIEPQFSINKFLVSQGLTTKKELGAKSVGFASTVLRYWNSDMDASKRALSLQGKLIGPNGGILSDRVHTGLYYLEHNDINCAIHYDKLFAAGGVPALDHQIHAVGVECSAKRLTERLCAVGILRIINSGKRRNKITLPALSKLL